MGGGTLREVEMGGKGNRNELINKLARERQREQVREGGRQKRERERGGEESS